MNHHELDRPYLAVTDTETPLEPKASAAYLMRKYRITFDAAKDMENSFKEKLQVSDYD